MVLGEKFKSLIGIEFIRKKDLPEEEPPQKAQTPISLTPEQHLQEAYDFGQKLIPHLQSFQREFFQKCNIYNYEPWRRRLRQEVLLPKTEYIQKIETANRHLRSNIYIADIQSSLRNFNLGGEHIPSSTLFMSKTKAFLTNSLINLERKQRLLQDAASSLRKQSPFAKQK